MAAAYRLRSGHSSAALNANALLLQSLLLNYLDAIPVDEVEALTIDCNGHDIINFGVGDTGSPSLEDEPFHLTADTTNLSADSTEHTSDTVQ